jgi:hypothetical protein
MAEILNQHGVETYYVSLSKRKSGHDSSQFHYGNRSEDWDLSHMFGDDFLFDSKILRRLNIIKKKYNISKCFATGRKAYLLKKAGIGYRYWSYGSDLDQQCFKPVFQTKYPFLERYLVYPYFFTIRHNARKSLCQADSVMISPYQKRALNQICSDKKIFFLPHFLEVSDYNELLQKRIKNKKIICKKIQAEHFFFSSTRHVWAGNLKSESDNKGNDIILKSFKQYTKIVKDHNAKLILVEKGPDIESSKSLARELNIDKYIVWLTEMRRGEISRYYQGASICFGQFGTPVITFAALEPLANACVCTSFHEANNSEVPYYSEMPPLFNSKDPDEIAFFISKVMADETYLNELCYKSWVWAKNNCSEENFVESFIKLFNQKISA